MNEGKLASRAEFESKVTFVAKIIDNSGDKLYTVFYPLPERETVILLHGGPGFPDDMADVSHLLTRQFQVIVFHQRGTGRSPCPSGDYSMEAYMSDIDIIAAHFGVPKFHLFGHSWGGLYAQIYAQRHPEKILSMFLCCPGGGTGPEWKQTEKEVLRYNRSKCSLFEWAGMGMNSLLGMLGSASGYKRLVRQIMINYNKDFVGKGCLIIDTDNIRGQPIRRTRMAIASYPVLRVASNPAFGITIVYGDQDIYGVSKGYVIGRYPTARVLTIEKSGHFSWLHNPAAFKEVMERHFHLFPRTSG